MAQLIRNLPVSAGDTRDLDLIPWSRRPPGEGVGNQLQPSFLENSMDRGALWATVHGVSESERTECSCTPTQINKNEYERLTHAHPD